MITTKCDRCEKEIPDNEYGGNNAARFTVQLLKNGVWSKLDGNLCEACTDSFFRWVGA